MRGRAIRRAAICLLALVGLCGETASAQPRAQPAGRRRDLQERRIQAPDDDEPRRRRPRAEDAAAGPENLEEALYLRERPDALGESSRRFQNAQLERLLASRERMVVARRTAAINLLETFIREEPERAAEMADALLRLAELYWELARAEYVVAFAAWQQVPEGNRSADPPVPDYRRAVTLYDRLLTQHRDFDRLDLVLYMKAYALVEQSKMDEALVLYRQILSQFPESRFVPDAHMALAEAAFTGTYDYAAALAEYEQVMRHRESELYDIALFKSAWCLWRLNRSREAATRFRQVLDLANDRAGLSSAQRRRLQELQTEALDYLIQVFTEDESNSAADVFRFLQEIGGERYATRVLGRLSETYFDQARYENGIAAYRLLLELSPSDEHAPEWQAEIAAGFAQMDQPEHVVEELTRLAAGVAPGSPWATGQGDPERVRRMQSMAERAVRRQALRYHEAAQRDRQQPKFERAVQLYQIYLQHFGRSEHAYDITFYMAEILFHRLNRNAEAGEAYLAAVRLNRTGQYSRDALYNAIGAFERVRETEMQRCTPAQAQQPGGCAETDNDRKFSEAITLYVELFPNDPDLPEILFRQGRLYYDRGIYDPAVRLFGQLLERFPQSQYAEPAGELILDSFNRAQDYANIESWARRLKTAPAFRSAESQRRLDGLILQAVFKIGEQLAARGEHAEAANAYYRAAEEFPNDNRARQAYYNAGLERQRAGDLAGAAEAYERLIERHPGSTEGALGAWAGAQMYESIAQFRDAAHFYEAYATRFPNGEHAADALYNAVLLRVTANDDDEAVRNGQEFVRRFPRHESADAVYFLVGRAHEHAEDWREAAQTYREFIRRSRDLDRKTEATTRLAIVLIRGGDRRAADRALDDAVELGRRNGSRLTGNGLYYAAQARYMQGDQVLAEYEAIHIEGDFGGLRRRLEQKSQLLQRASLIYADVVEFHVAEWVTAALYQMGRSYELYAEGLRNAPVPEGLGEDETQAYQDLLASAVVPIEERALEAYEGGYQKAIELRIFNVWTQRLREALTRLNDVQYPPLREMGGDIVEGTPMAAPEPLDGLRRGEAAAGSSATRPAAAPPGAPPAPPPAPAVQTQDPGQTGGRGRGR